MIIIPTYNERNNIRTLVGRIRAVLPEIGILFVDDNSPDGTAEEITDLQKADKNIHLLKRGGKFGFASAYLDGFGFVLKDLRPEFIITMDGDLSHPPEKLPEMIEATSQGKVAVGSRYVLGGAIKNWTLRRKILSRFGNLYARLLTKMPVKDLTSGFIAIPIQRLRQLDLATIQSRGYAFLIELKVRLLKLGSEIVEIPITFEERREGQSKLGGNIIAEGIKYPARLFWKRQAGENRPAWLVFLITFFVYASTLPRTIFFGDSAEFISAAATLGITHPPGYPLYTLIAKLFTFLPFGSLEYRVGLFSALTASLSLVVFYFLFLRIAKNRSIAFVSAVILGFSSLFWSQAIMAKVYAPLLFITFSVFLLFAKFWETDKPKYLVYAALLFGLGATMHQIILLFLPLLLFAVGVYLYKVGNLSSRRFDIRPFFLGCLVFLLGLSIYFFLPIRAGMDGNFYDFSRIFRTNPALDTLSGLYHYVLRSEYKDFGGAFDWQDKLLFVSSFFESLWHQFYWLLILAPIGLVRLMLTNRKFSVLTLGAFLLNLLGIILLRSSAWNFENEMLYSYYYLPAFAMVALWIGYGLSTLFKLIVQKIPKETVIRLSVIMIVLPLGLFYVNFKTMDLSRFTFVDEYTKSVLESLPQDALLLAHYQGANTDSLLFGLNYQQIVKQLRSDVMILTVADIYPEVDRNIIGAVFDLSNPAKARYNLLNYTLKHPEYNQRPVYTTFLASNLAADKTWSQVSNGLVYKFLPDALNQDLNNDINNYKQLDYSKDLKIMESDMFGQDLLSQYFYTQAAYWASRKDLSQTQANFILGIKYDYKVMEIDQKDFMHYRSKIFGGI